MKLTLSQNELEQAVRNYVTGMISLQEGTDIVIDFKAGRGDNGFTAEVDINYLAVTAIPSIQASVAAVAASPNKVSGETKPKAVIAEPETETQAKPPVEEPTPEPDAKAVRKTAGKALFGNVKDVDAGAPPAAVNDADDQAEEPAAVAAAGGGERKSLFNQ